MSLRHLALATVCAAAAFTSAASPAPRVVVSAYTFHTFTVFEAVDRAAECGAHFIETFTNQSLSPDDATKIYALNDAQRARLRAHLAERGVGIASCMGAVPADETKARAFFRLVQELGASNLGTDSVDSIATIEKIIGDFHLTVAFHNHPANPQNRAYRNSDPQFMLDLLEGRDPRIGVCADTGHYATSNVVPLEAIKLLHDRIKSVHLKERAALGRKTPDQVYGTGVNAIADILTELRAQHFGGLLVIEYETNPKNNLADVKQCMAYLKAHGFD